MDGQNTQDRQLLYIRGCSSDGALYAQGKSQIVAGKNSPGVNNTPNFTRSQPEPIFKRAVFGRHDVEGYGEAAGLSVRMPRELEAVHPGHLQIRKDQLRAFGGSDFGGRRRTSPAPVPGAQRQRFAI